MLAEIAVASA